MCSQAARRGGGCKHSIARYSLWCYLIFLGIDYMWPWLWLCLSGTSIFIQFFIFFSFVHCKEWLKQKTIFVALSWGISCYSDYIQIVVKSFLGPIKEHTEPDQTENLLFMLTILNLKMLFNFWENLDLKSGFEPSFN